MQEVHSLSLGIRISVFLKFGNEFTYILLIRLSIGISGGVLYRKIFQVISSDEFKIILKVVPTLMIDCFTKIFPL